MPQQRDKITSAEFIGWWVFHRLDSNPTPMPAKIGEWVGQAMRPGNHPAFHAELRSEYKEYQSKYGPNITVTE